MLVLKAGMEDISGRFLPRRRTWCKERQMWAMVRQGWEASSQTDYILGSDCRIFRNVAVRYLRHNSDHFMVMGCLRGASPREHYCYLEQRTRLPLTLPGGWTRTRVNKIFSKLRRAVSKRDNRAAPHNSWILHDTWRLINKRVCTRIGTRQ